MNLRQILQRLTYNPYRHIQKLPFAKVGADTRLDGARFQFILGENNFTGAINIGRDCIFMGEMIFESNQGEISFGDGSFMNGGSRLIARSRIQIGKGVTIAWGCTIYDHNSHSMDPLQRAVDQKQQLLDLNSSLPMIQNKDWSKVKSKPIIIEDNVWIGFNCTILSGVTVGEGSVIGAGSVVRVSIPPWSLVYGNPAVIVRSLK